MKLKKPLIGIALLLVLTIVASLLYVSQFRPRFFYRSVEQIDADARTTGLTDCFWLGVLASNAGGANYAYPDNGVNYWITQFRLPAGAKIEFDGEYPHARHMSFNVYDDLGQPVDRLNDLQIQPQPGAVNPFLPQALRNAPQRAYKVRLAQGDVAAGMPMAQVDAGRPVNTLFIPRGDAPVQLFLRVYVQDKAVDPKGGVPLPRPTLTLADGATLQGEALCRAIVQKEKSLRDNRLTLDAARTLLALQSSTSPYHPAQPEPRWTAFLNPPATFASALEGTRFGWIRGLLGNQRKGGFYSTLDNTYMYVYVDDRLGDLLVLHGKAPTTPRTAGGEAVMQSAQLRYWSVCKYRSLYDTAVDHCVYDEQVPLDTQGNYTIVFSAPDKRPANAREECGIAWRPWGIGDGIDNPHGGMLVMRHMMPAADFTQSIFATSTPGDEKEKLGPYYPQSRYQSRSDFESRGCASGG